MSIFGNTPVLLTGPQSVPPKIIIYRQETFCYRYILGTDLIQINFHSQYARSVRNRSDSVRVTFLVNISMPGVSIVVFCLSDLIARVF